MIETDTLLEKCPRCGAWPMAANLRGQRPRNPQSVSDVLGVADRRLANCGAQPFCAMDRDASLTRREMRIPSHSESHIMELENRSRWRTLFRRLASHRNRKADTGLSPAGASNGVSSHALANADQERNQSQLRQAAARRKSDVSRQETSQTR